MADQTDNVKVPLSATCEVEDLVVAKVVLKVVLLVVSMAACLAGK